MNQFQGKILVIRGGAIGDFILTLPAIAALRRQFPTAHLEVLGYPHIAQLALAGGLVNRVQSIEAGALAGFFARNGELAEDLADYFSEFDVILSYLYDPDRIFQTNVGLCTAAQFIVGPHRADEQRRLHATKVYLQPLERLAIFDADPIPRLPIAPRPSPLPLVPLLPRSWPCIRAAAATARTGLRPNGPSCSSTCSTSRVTTSCSSAARPKASASNAWPPRCPRCDLA